MNSLELAEAGLSLGEYGVAGTRAVIVFFASAESASYHGGSIQAEGDGAGPTVHFSAAGSPQDEAALSVRHEL